MPSANSVTKITDVGEVLPFAKKHEMAGRDFDNSASDITLNALWPEPDWEACINDGMDEYIASHIAAIYLSLRKKPRSSNRGFAEITDQAWSQAYIQGIGIMEKLCMNCQSYEDVEQLNTAFAQEIGYSHLKALHKASLAKSLPYWAINRGETTLKHPTSKKTVLHYLADYLPDLGWPESDLAIKVGRFPLSFTNDTFAAGWSSGQRAAYRDSEVFDDIEDCLDFIRELHQAEIEKQDTPELKVPKKPACKNIARTGPEHRHEDITAETLMSTFHFRGIQFGASMGEKEKQNWVNAIYDGLCDLSLALNLPKGWIGLKGLGLAFGARGSGNALAHYELSLRIINLTRKKGASSTGHEWSHGLDHRLGGVVNGYSDFASTNVLKGFKSKSDMMTPAIQSLSALMAFMTNPQCAYFKRSKTVQGIKGARKYWTEPHELFARAFECFLQDTLQSKGIVNPWLVYGTRPEDYHRFEEQTFPYPLADERIQINQLFSNLFIELNKLS